MTTKDLRRVVWSAVARMAAALVLVGCESDLIYDESAETIDEVGRAGRTRACGTRNPTDAELQELERGMSNSAAVAEALGSTTIRVWVHAIDRGAGLANGDVPDAMIAAQIAVLNASYSGETGGARTPFRFTLAGITRTRDARWFDECNRRSVEAEIKDALHTGGSRMLNLYTCNPGNSLLGWATGPRAYARDPSSDGVVLLYSTLPGGGEAPFDEGDTATHEVGHWLGLLHTFQGGCGEPNDRVDDTPRERREGHGCPRGRNTCRGDGGHDPIHNFMDYTNDACIFEFTRGQSARMENMWVSYRR